LLLSAYCCWVIVAEKIGENRAIYETWSKSELHYHAARMAVQAATFSRVLGGTIPVGSEIKDVSKCFSEWSEKLTKDMAELEKPPEELKASKARAVFAILCMQSGLVLLCWSAVKLLLPA